MTKRDVVIRQQYLHQVFAPKKHPLLPILVEKKAAYNFWYLLKIIIFIEDNIPSHKYMSVPLCIIWGWIVCMWIFNLPLYQ